MRDVASSLTGLYTITQVRLITLDSTLDSPDHFESNTQFNSTKITQISQNPQNRKTQGPRPTISAHSAQRHTAWTQINTFPTDTRSVGWGTNSQFQNLELFLNSYGSTTLRLFLVLSRQLYSNDWGLLSLARGIHSVASVPIWEWNPPIYVFFLLYEFQIG